MHTVPAADEYVPAEAFYAIAQSVPAGTPAAITRRGTPAQALASPPDHHDVRPRPAADQDAQRPGRPWHLLPPTLGIMPDKA